MNSAIGYFYFPDIYDYSMILIHKIDMEPVSTNRRQYLMFAFLGLGLGFLLCSVDLHICFVQASWCLDHYNSVTKFGIWNVNASNIIPFKDAF